MNIINEFFHAWLNGLQHFLIIINSSLSGIIVAFVGYRIWKNQNLYNKKLESYIKAITNLLLARDVINDMISPLRLITIKEKYETHKDIFLNIKTIKYEFRIYFNSKFDSNFDIFENTIHKLLNCEFSYLEGDISIEQKLIYKRYIYSTESNKETMILIDNAIKEIELLYNTKKHKFIN